MLTTGPVHHHRHCLDAPLSPGLPPGTGTTSCVWCSLSHASAWDLRAEPGLISDWPCQALVCTPPSSSKAPKLSTGTPCSCTRTRLQLQIMLEGGCSDTQCPQPGFWNSLLPFPVTSCTNYCCFFQQQQFQLLHQPSCQHRSAENFDYHPWLHAGWGFIWFFIWFYCVILPDITNNKILKDQYLTSSPPIRLGFFPPHWLTSKI